MIFLGMQRAPKSSEDKKNDPLLFREQTMQEARLRQADNQKRYEKDQVEL